MNKKHQEDSLIGKTICIEVTKVKIQSKIYQGTHSEVYKVYRLSDHKHFALKRVHAAHGDEEAHRSYI
jgi:hypothetical protein